VRPLRPIDKRRDPRAVPQKAGLSPAGDLELAGLAQTQRFDDGAGSRAKQQQRTSDSGNACRAERESTGVEGATPRVAGAAPRSSGGGRGGHALRLASARLW
jgi:hypothetical protein